jgi:serine/threonine protein kinase
MTDESLFAAALERRTPEERAAFLAAACDDPEQRARVEALLAVLARAAPSVSQPPASDSTRTAAPAESDPLLDALLPLAPSNYPDSLGRIGQYEVMQVLGRGGFGIVYRAFDEKLRRVVAVKVLAPHLAVTSPARKRFLREARATAAVRHENVVQVYAVEEHPLPHLVMEYIPGETLQQRIERGGPLDAAEVLRLGRQIADGLAAAHAKGLIHRDVKPANILIDPELGGRAKITDFGLARTVDDASQTQSSALAGTPMYMAPEQARGETLDHRADLFSLGSVLYALLTGRPPFRAANMMAVLRRVCDDTPRPIREIIPEVPAGFVRIVEKLHAKNRDDRFQTAREVSLALAECEQSPAAPPSSVKVRPSPAAPPPPVAARPVRRDTARPPVRRVKLAAAGLSVLFLLGLLVWGVLAVTQPPPPPSTTQPTQPDPPPPEPPPPGPTRYAVPSGMEADGDDEFTLVGGGQKLPVWVKATVKGEVVRFRLIPAGDPAGVQPFYISERKASNAVVYPNPADRPGGPTAPAVGCTAAEAMARIRASFGTAGGRLPTPAEWDHAAGLYDHPPGQVAVTIAGGIAGVRRKEPAPPTAGPKGDVNSFGLLDMAGNGREWTCGVITKFDTPPEVTLRPAGPFKADDLLVLRGRNYTLKEGLTFAQLVQEASGELLQRQLAGEASP